MLGWRLPLLGLAAISMSISQALPAWALQRALPACPFGLPEDFGAIPQPQDPTSEEGSDEQDEPSPGIALPNSSGCLFLSQEVISGSELKSVRTRNTGGDPGALNVLSSTSQLGATFGLTHVDGRLEDPLVTALSIRAGPDGQASLNQVSIGNSRFTAGMDSSRFDSWGGDEFSFRSLAPAQSPAQAAAVLGKGERWIALVSLEDPSFRRVTVSGYGGSNQPDLVARWAGQLGPATLVLAGASHQTTLADNSRFQGYAGIASLKYDLEALGNGSYVLVQGTVAHKALGYLGINTTSNALSLNLPGVLSAAVAEQGRGLSGAAVAVWEVSDRWRLAAYSTAARLNVPILSGGDLTSWRSAANVKWSPAKGFDFILEGGLGRTLSGISIIPSSTTKSMVMTVSKSL